MSRLNTGTRKITAPLATSPVPTGKTHEGARGFAREERSELFMRATTMFAGEDSFYEDAAKADARAVGLVRKLAVEDWEWVREFLPWLRADGNIRTMSIMLAMEAAQARSAAKLTGEGIPQLVDGVLLRADEPGEAAQYWLRKFGKLPRGGHVKKGIALAAARLYNQTSALRWDKDDRPMRFADVVELTRPKARLAVPTDGIRAKAAAQDDPEGFLAEWAQGRREEQNRLFKFLLDERHHGDGSYDGLGVLAARRTLSQMPPAERHAMAAHALADREGPEMRQIARAAARQWEWTGSWLGEGADNLKTALSKRERWELVIPEMGYMALLRNLRNFEEAGIKKSLVNKIVQRLSDPAEVAASRQLPFRFLSAHLNTNGAQWVAALEQALQGSLVNIPMLTKPTLILIDTSGSMQTPLSAPPVPRGRKPSTAKRPDRVLAAAVFAIGLALRNPGKVDVYGFANSNFRVDNIEFGSSLLRTAQLFAAQVGKVGHGTLLEQNLRQTFDSRRHGCVAMFTDMQAFPHGNGYGYGVGDVTSAVPKDVPLFAWNLAGYSNSAMATGENRYELAGLTDHSFGIMQRVLQGRDAEWPWTKEMRRLQELNRTDWVASLDDDLDD